LIIHHCHSGQKKQSPVDADMQDKQARLIQKKARKIPG